ncbi:MAG: hypothetical protein ABJE66_18780 [Deltaproteobacteria bacterium]
MRWATLCLVLAFACAFSCNDVRAYEGSWTGKRVGDTPVLRVGVADAATATLAIDSIDTHGMRGHLSIANLVTDADVASVAGAEADVLSGMTFNGSPQRVYLSFAAVPDGGGEALVVIALYDPTRIEVRVLRGGTMPLYAIFALAQT